MALTVYRKKRVFSKTTEPRGDKRKHEVKNLFVVHKHAARRLHYDLRLEMGGVLKSWAVPRGPSMSAFEKRLAVNVEDHPVEYADFEGNIPGGEYGAGNMIIWDKGKWEILDDKPLNAYENGKIKFVLHGKKLMGKWSLIRMKRNEKQWLLFKEKDEYSTNEDILEKKPGSVVSGLKIGDIDLASPKNKKAIHTVLPDPSELTGAVKSGIPETLKPELASSAEKPPLGESWLYEIKYDGYRILCFIDNGKARFVTRNGYDWTGKFKTLAQYCSRLPVENAILDGELTVSDEKGVSNFQLLQDAIEEQSEETLQYFIFDLPYYNGYSLKKTPLNERKKVLKKILENNNSAHIIYSEHLTGKGDDLLKSACKLGLEGVISKEENSIYLEKRSKSWVKLKCGRQQEFVIGGYTRPQGSRTGFGALLLGFYRGGNLVYCGKVGTGFNIKTLNSLYLKLTSIEVRDSPFSNLKTEEDVFWVKPELIAQVSFINWTNDLLLRQASFLGLREDKNPGEVNSGLPEKNFKKNIVSGISITHPDKILFDGLDINKFDLALYYEKVAGIMLPHIAGRPLVLLRCPDGVRGKCFFQKHPVESLPGSIKTFQFREKDSVKDYIYIDDAGSLITLVQYGVIEFHIMDTIIDQSDKPDRMVFDLDPDTDLKPEVVTAGALNLREFLLEYGLQSFVKTTGGKGLHIVVPIERTLSWLEVKDISNILAGIFVKRWPDYLTSVMSKALRKGKIFVDFFRNSIGATWAAPYTVRARQSAPVSMPVFWDELTKELRFDEFTLLNVNERLEKFKKDPWEDIFRVRQRIPNSLIKMIK